MKRVLFAAVGGLVMWSITAGAAVSDITINDTIGTTSGNSWYRRNLTPTSENQEVEINCIANQYWDLERFLLDTTTSELQIQGGFNMLAGYGGFYSGDIFINVDSAVQWGSAITTDPSPNANNFYSVANSQYGWDYAIRFDRSTTAAGGGALTGGYSVYSLSGATDVEVYYDQNNQSNPYRYLAGGTLVAGGLSGLSQSSFSDGEGTHYTLGGIDLSWLSGRMGAAPVTFHFTEGCGNDLLIGQTTSWSRVPDGGLTLVLLGGSLSALGIVSRRMRKNR